MQTPFFQANSKTLLQTAIRQLPAVLVLFSLAFIPGCPGGGVVTDLVTGKITVGDKPVSGEVTFIGPDKKEVRGAALEGSYQVFNPPKGMCTITVKGTPMVGGKPPEIKEKDVGKVPISTVGTGAPPPVKYEKADTSDLKFEVKGGKQEFDIKMTP